MRIESITVDLQDVKSIERSEKKKAELENKGWHYVETQVDEALQMAVIYYRMKNTKQIKLMIIENYIDWFTTNEEEREQMKKDARLYVEEDWVDEIAQSE